MKMLTYVMFALLIGIGTALAAGGKNQGETGTGETSTGDDAQGQAEQARAGRDDASAMVFWMEQE